MVDKIVLENGSWIVKTFGPRYYTATAKPSNNLCYPEHRIYYSRDAVERDFGRLVVKGESDATS
jgi:hypothetical protein